MRSHWPRRVALSAGAIVGVMGLAVLVACDLHYIHHTHAAASSFLGAGLRTTMVRTRPSMKALSEWIPLGAGLGLAIAVLGIWLALVDPGDRLLSHVILAGGLLMAALVALLLYMDQQARARSRDQRHSEEHFRRVFEEGPTGLALLGNDGKIAKVNSTLCRMLGYSDVELTRMSFRDITHPDDPWVDAPLRERLFSGQIPAYETEKRYVKKSGEIVWAKLAASVVHDSKGHALCGLATITDITERKHAEQKLRDQAALLGRAHDAIVVRDLNYKITFWNQGAVDTYGWTTEQALGQDIRDIIPTKFPTPCENIEAVLQTREEWEGELEHTTRDGRVLVMDSRWSLLRDERQKPCAILQINRDVSARKRSEEEMRSLSERFCLATRVASIGVWDWDLRTDLGNWDETMYEMFGIPKTVPASYAMWAQRVHPDDLPKTEDLLRNAIRTGTQYAVEFRIIRPDGSLRHIAVAAGMVRDDRGVASRVVGTAVDITDRKRMEAEIEAGKEQMIASARLSALGMMAGGIAHEINNPLGIIHALASDLVDIVSAKRSAPPQMVLRNSERIRVTAERIARIVKNLRYISREGSGDRLHPVPVGRILEEALDVCRERFRAHSVKLVVPETVPDLMVSCREVQIAQVLLNLLQNAFDAVMEQPGQRWVQLDVSPCEDSVVVSVTDNGPGIPSEHRSRIMEPFFTTKAVGKGTGLGLSLSKSIAEEHGGALVYRQDQRGHTRFSLVLPLARQAETAWT